jgi:hypothetical protein
MNNKSQMLFEKANLLPRIRYLGVGRPDALGAPEPHVLQSVGRLTRSSQGASATTLLERTERPHSLRVLIALVHRKFYWKCFLGDGYRLPVKSPESRTSREYNVKQRKVFVPKSFDYSQCITALCFFMPEKRSAKLTSEFPQLQQ